MKNTLQIIHNDLDGISPIILNRYYKIDYYKEISTNYEEKGEHDSLRQFTNLEKVIYVDFTPDEEAYEIIRQKDLECIVIDHHISQFDNMTEKAKDNPKLTYIFDNEKSGTLLYYEYLTETLNYEKKDIVGYFCNLVSTYDLYNKQSPLWTKAQNLNRLLYKVINWANRGTLAMYDFFINGQLWKLENCESYSFNKFEETKIDADIKAEKDILNEFISGKRRIKTRVDEQGRYFAVIILNKKVSAIASLLLERYKKLDYIVIINDYEKDCKKVSLRSKEHINLLEFEGVKGHKNACGYPNVDNQFCDDLWMGKVYSLKKLES